MFKSSVLFLFMLLLSCTSSSPNQTSIQVTTETPTLIPSVQEEIIMKSQKDEAIIIGHDIVLYSKYRQAMDTLFGLIEEFVQITGVSEKWFKENPSNEYCESFRYVQMLIGNKEVIADGRSVFRLLSGEDILTHKLESKTIQFIRTETCGLPVQDKEGLTFCGDYTPTVFVNHSTNFKGIVHMVRNGKEDDEYDYFMLRADDGAYDEIRKIKADDGGYILSIKREYQEGGTDLLIYLRKKEDGSFEAETLENEHWDIEDEK